MLALAISSGATRKEVDSIISMIGEIPKNDKIIKTLNFIKKSRQDI